jgi:CrcB protein
MMAVDLVLVAVGGALGSVSRYMVAMSLSAASGSFCGFPVATLVVNYSGCIAAGVLAGLGERFGYLTPAVRHLLFFGFLGGFTTFSAFGLETTLLLRAGDFAIALGYVLASIAGGVVLTYAAYSATMW